MRWIDYGQVPAIEAPDLKNARVVRAMRKADGCSEKKYISNQFINSPNKGSDGFSLVGVDNITGRWRLLKSWAVW